MRKIREAFEALCEGFLGLGLIFIILVFAVYFLRSCVR